jgi:hypothetical protein
MACRAFQPSPSITLKAVRASRYVPSLACPPATSAVAPIIENKNRQPHTAQENQAFDTVAYISGIAVAKKDRWFSLFTLQIPAMQLCAIGCGEKNIPIGK